MPTTKTIKFEGVAPHNSYVSDIPDGYEGFDWFAVGALDKGYLKHQLDTDTNGYARVLHGSGVAWVPEIAGEVRANISRSDVTFSVNKGVFAAAWNMGEVVTFHGYVGNTEIGTKTVVLD
jgi:hypothetical protein